MAARYRKIDPRIWTDENFRLLTSEQQRIALYILTAQMNRIGLFSFSPGKACEDLNLSPRIFNKRFLQVCETLHWQWDPLARVLYLPTWWRYNPPESVNNMLGNLKDLADLPATPLLAQFAANTAYLSEDIKQTFIEALVKWYPNHSPHPTSTQKQDLKQQQKQQQDTPPAVEHEFEEFWGLFPARNGKKLEKSAAAKKFQSLKPEDRRLVLIAVRHYAASELVQKGIGVKDAHRWLRNGKDSEPWRDWVEPENKQAGKEQHDGRAKLPRVGFEERDYRQGTF